MELDVFIKETVMKLDDEQFKEFSNRINGVVKHVFVAYDHITKEVLAEKLCDVLLMVCFKNGKSFDKIIARYIECLNMVVEPRIPKGQKIKLNKKETVVTRSMKYYSYGVGVIKSDAPELSKLEDYTRIMLCLYSSIIAHDFKEIDDMNYALKSINIDHVLSAIHREKNTGLKTVKKQMFDLEVSYSMDVAAYIILIIMYYHLKNNEIRGEY